jgi:hypothetical protein
MFHPLRLGDLVKQICRYRTGAMHALGLSLL